MFIPAEVFIKDNIQILKLSNALYGRPTDSDRELIYLSKFLRSPSQGGLTATFDLAAFLVSSQGAHNLAEYGESG